MRPTFSSVDACGAGMVRGRATSSNENPNGARADVFAGVGGRGQEDGRRGARWWGEGTPVET